MFQKQSFIYLETMLDIEEKYEPNKPNRHGKGHAKENASDA